MYEKRNKKGIGVITFMYLLLSVVYIAIGFAEIFVPEFKQNYVVIIAGFLLLIIGILLIVQYFVSGGFKDLGKYGFSVGVLCVLAGAIVLIRCSDITGMLGTFLGICILFTAVIKLQNTVDMKILDHSGWIIFLFIAAVFLIFSILIILNPSQMFTKHMNWIFYVMIADGIVNLFSTVYLWILIKADARRSTKIITKTQDDGVPFAHRETAAERISEDDIEVIVPNQVKKKEQPDGDDVKKDQVKGSFWKRIQSGSQDK